MSILHSSRIGHVLQRAITKYTDWLQLTQKPCCLLSCLYPCRLPEAVLGRSIQLLDLREAHLVERSRPVGGAVHSLIVHEHGHPVGSELQVQFNPRRSIFTGLAWWGRHWKNGKRKSHGTLKKSRTWGEENLGTSISQRTI